MRVDVRARPLHELPLPAVQNPLEPQRVHRRGAQVDVHAARARDRAERELGLLQLESLKPLRKRRFPDSDRAHDAEAGDEAGVPRFQERHHVAPQHLLRL